jgi:hypothetical protein
MLFLCLPKKVPEFVKVLKIPVGRATNSSEPNRNQEKQFPIASKANPSG